MQPRHVATCHIRSIPDTPLWTQLQYSQTSSKDTWQKLGLSTNIGISITQHVVKYYLFFLIPFLPRSQLSRSQQELRQHSRERDKLESSQQQHALDHEDMGPIRIRNLEDLIRLALCQKCPSQQILMSLLVRQLEHSSNRHMSPAGSEDVRMNSETEADRHFR